jgi:IS30 family transposase
MEERESLEQFKKEGLSIREMARRLERSPSSISREFKRNSNRNKIYNYWRAYCLYKGRKRKNNRRKLHPNTEAWNYIIDKLKKYWSPEQIVMRYEREHGQKPISVKTLYNYIGRGEFPKIKKKEHLRRRGKRKYSRKTNFNTIKPDRIIPEWTEVIKLRLRVGDWEGDSVLGAVGKGGVTTLVDRKTCYLVAGLIVDKSAETTEKTIVKALTGMPVKSLSLDNGSEFANFKSIEAQIKAPIYFAEPHKPWQRGTNENMNDVLRFFFPKGTDFTKVTDEQLQEIVTLINNRPRKCLGWLSPYEALFDVALD